MEFGEQSLLDYDHEWTGRERVGDGDVQRVGEHLVGLKVWGDLCSGDYHNGIPRWCGLLVFDRA